MKAKRTNGNQKPSENPYALRGGGGGGEGGAAPFFSWIFKFSFLL